MPDNRPMPLTGEEKIQTHPALGDPIDNFPSRRLPPLLTAWGFLIGISLLWNLATWPFDLSAYGPAIAITFALIALVLGWWVMHLWNREVILYERGLTYREGSRDVPFRYDELRGIRLRAEQLAYFGGALRRTIYRITLHTHNGETIPLNNIYRRVQVLGDKLNQRVTDLRRPDILAAISNGESVPFGGGLSLNSAGITVAASELAGATDDAHLPWAAFSGYNIAKRHLQLLTDEEAIWYSLPLHEVENLVLLLEVLRQQRDIATEARAS